MKIEIPDEVVDALAERVAVKLRDALQPPPPATAERYVTRRQAAAMGVPTRALVRAERRGAIEAFCLGRAKTYRRQDVLNLVEDARSNASAPVAAVLPMDPWDRALARAQQRRSGR